MNVKEKVVVGENHSIEWGEATWDNNDQSIRNRYDTESGKFNMRGSGEIPWEDFKTMIHESIKRGYFADNELADILITIGKKLK